MSSTTTKLDNLEDIEVGSNQNISKRTPSTTTKYSNMESSDSCGTNCCLKSTFWLLVMIIGFPIPFCDLYYGYTDDTCVLESAGKLAINLKDYLLVYGWIVMSMIGLLSVVLCFFDINSFGSKKSNSDGCYVCGVSFLTIINSLVNIFLTIWNIFGAVIFWSLMDTSECSNSIYNYVFASLIIKLVFNVISILQSKNDKDK